MFKKENFSFSGGKDKDKLLDISRGSEIINFLTLLCLFSAKRASSLWKSSSYRICISNSLLIMKQLPRLFFILTILSTLTACTNNEPNPQSSAPAVTIKPIITCDTFAIDKPEIREAKKALSVWLEDCSLDWFLEKRQMAWREAIAWSRKIFPVDSNEIIKCLCNEKKNIFLYIPHHFYYKQKNGNRYFQFFIVNNSTDTIPIPRIDAVIDNVASSVSYIANDNTSQQWFSFQKTSKLVECGNSFWTMKLPPHTVIASQIESEYLNLGDTSVYYRLELTLGKEKIISNDIKINLMKKQMPFLGKPFD
jgi:hypothetical protein